MKFDETYRLRKMARLVSGPRVLDIGCAQMPNPYLAGEVVGLDRESAVLPGNYRELVIADVLDLPTALLGSFDSVVIGEVLEHVNDPVLFLDRCASALVPGGRVVLSTPNPHSPIEFALNVVLDRRFFYTGDHTMLYPQRWLVRIMENAGLRRVRLFSGGMPVPFLGLVPFPRQLCYQTIATGEYRPGEPG
jgi:SAM-dependent methyltransferase